MTDLIFIRHGQSEGNLDNRFLGHIDRPLTELGHSQAVRTAAFLASRHIDAVYASDLMRAVQTAQPIAEARGLPVVTMPALREVNAGKWEGHTFAELTQLFPESYGVWRRTIGLAHPDGGESIAALQARLAKATAELAERHEGQTICIVTHATSIRILKCLWLGVPLAEAHTVPWPTNASVTEVQYAGTHYSILMDAQDEHLREQRTVVPGNV